MSARRLVPIVFAHMCCGERGIFGQAANGDCYWRDPNWGPGRGWVPVPPPLGVAVTKPRRSKPARRAHRR
jgi:hypothetical protein